MLRATETLPVQRSDDRRAPGSDVPTIRRVAASEIPDGPGTVGQPNAVGSAGSTLRPGSVDRPGPVGRTNSGGRTQLRRSTQLRRTTQLSRTTQLRRSTRRGERERRTPLTLDDPSHAVTAHQAVARFGSGHVAGIPGRWSVPRADQPGNAVGFSQEVTQGPGTSARSLEVVGGRAGMVLRRSTGANPLLLPRVVVGLPGALPSRGPVAPIGSGPARLPVGTAAPQFISPREMRESLRPPATTGYLTARRQRWGLGGSHVAPALSTLAATRHVRGTVEVLGGHDDGRSWVGRSRALGPVTDPSTGNGRSDRGVREPGPSAPQQANAHRRPAMSQPVSGDAASPEAGGSQRVATGQDRRPGTDVGESVAPSAATIRRNSALNSSRLPLAIDSRSMTGSASRHPRGRAPNQSWPGNTDPSGDGTPARGSTSAAARVRSDPVTPSTAAGSPRPADSPSYAERASTPIISAVSDDLGGAGSAGTSVASTSPAVGSRLGGPRRRTAPMIHRLAALAQPVVGPRGTSLYRALEPLTGGAMTGRYPMPNRLGRSSLLGVVIAPQFISPSIVHRSPHPPHVGSSVLASRPSHLAPAQGLSRYDAPRAADLWEPRPGRPAGPGRSVSPLSMGGPVRRAAVVSRPSRLPRAVAPISVAGPPAAVPITGSPAGSSRLTFASQAISPAAIRRNPRSPVWGTQAISPTAIRRNPRSPVWGTTRAALLPGQRPNGTAWPRYNEPGRAGVPASARSGAQIVPGSTVGGLRIVGVAAGGLASGGVPARRHPSDSVAARRHPSDSVAARHHPSDSVAARRHPSDSVAARHHPSDGAAARRTGDDIGSIRRLPARRSMGVASPLPLPRSLAVLAGAGPHEPGRSATPAAAMSVRIICLPADLTGDDGTYTAATGRGNDLGWRAGPGEAAPLVTDDRSRLGAFDRPRGRPRGGSGPSLAPPDAAAATLGRPAPGRCISIRSERPTARAAGSSHQRHDRACIGERCTDPAGHCQPQTCRLQYSARQDNARTTHRRTTHRRTTHRSAVNRGAARPRVGVPCAGGRPISPHRRGITSAHRAPHPPRAPVDDCQGRRASGPRPDPARRGTGRGAVPTDRIRRTRHARTQHARQDPGAGRHRTGHPATDAYRGGLPRPSDRPDVAEGPRTHHRLPIRRPDRTADLAASARAGSKPPAERDTRPLRSTVERHPSSGTGRAHQRHGTERHQVERHWTERHQVERYGTGHHRTRRDRTEPGGAPRDGGDRPRRKDPPPPTVPPPRSARRSAPCRTNSC